MVRLFRTEHRIDTDVDISSVAFWRQPFAPGMWLSPDCVPSGP
jgi:hypothetical protein